MLLNQLKMATAALAISNSIEKIAAKKNMTDDQVLEHMGKTLDSQFENMAEQPIEFFKQDAPELFQDLKNNPNLAQLAQAHFDKRVGEKMMEAAKALAEWGDEDKFTVPNLVLYLQYVSLQ